MGGCKNTGVTWKNHNCSHCELGQRSVNEKILIQINIQMMTEVQSWPYSFPASEDFQKSDQRGNIGGRLLVLDR